MNYLLCLSHGLKVLLISVLLVVTGNVYAVDNSPVLSRIQKSGKLVLGTSGTMPLMSEKLASGEVVGYDIDLANALAESMDVELEIKLVPFEALIPALESGKVDVVMSNMTITVDRNMHVAFAGPYFESGKCLITKESHMASTANASELKLSDASIIVVKGTTSEYFVKQVLPQLNLIKVADVDTGAAKVQTGEAKAMMTDFPVCLSIMKRFPDHGFQSIVSLLTYEPIGIAVPADDALFINLAQNFVTRAENVGVIDALKQKWFGDARITAVAEGNENYLK